MQLYKKLLPQLSVLSKIDNSRRSFLKKLGAAALGGISTLTFSRRSSADLTFDEALESLKAKTAGNPDDERFWSEVRSRFVLDPNLIHMNTSTEGAMLRSVVSSLYRHSMRFAEDPTEACIFDEDFEIKQIKNCLKTAEFMRAAPEEIVLTTNTTEGMHVALYGLNLGPGDEIITTLHEHGAVISPLQVLRDRKGITVKELALPSPAENKQLILDIFERAITKRSRVLCFCHINYTTGLRMPVKELCDLARDRGLISIVDGAHAVGMIDFDLHRLGCDFYACSGHKWLNGPPGTGILFIRDPENNPHGLWPVLTEIYSVKNAFPISKLLQIRGQQNTPALCAMTDAMKFHDAIGKDKVENRIIALNTYLKEKVVELWGEASLLSPQADAGMSSGIAAFIPFKKFSDRYKRRKFIEVCRTLRKEYRINMRGVWFKDQVSERKSTNVLRMSTHIFNNYNEIDKVLDAIKEVIKKV